MPKMKTLILITCVKWVLLIKHFILITKKTQMLKIF